MTDRYFDLCMPHPHQSTPPMPHPLQSSSPIPHPLQSSSPMPTSIASKKPMRSSFVFKLATAWNTSPELEGGGQTFQEQQLPTHLHAPLLHHLQHNYIQTYVHHSILFKHLRGDSSLSMTAFNSDTAFLSSTEEEDEGRTH